MLLDRAGTLEHSPGFSHLSLAIAEGLQWKFIKSIDRFLFIISLFCRRKEQALCYNKRGTIPCLKYGANFWRVLEKFEMSCLVALLFIRG